MSEKQGTPIVPPLNGGGGNNGGSNGGAPQQTVSLQQVLATAQSLNVLTGSGQQFVISSVPGLTQVLPSGATTSASLQQLGVTRIVNISNSSPRVSVVAVPGASNSTASPSRQTPTKVVLTTSPKLVRTSIGNMFVTPSGGASVVAPSQSPPARKRLKLCDESDVSGYRRWIIEHKTKKMRMAREKYAEATAELFFLCQGGNMMDYNAWRKRPPNSEYLHFLRQHRLDPDDDDEDLTVPLPSLEAPRTSAATIMTPTSSCQSSSTSTTASTESSVVPVTSSLPAAVAQIAHQGQIGRAQGSRHGMVFAIRPAVPGSSVTIHPSPTSTIAPTIIIGGTSIVLEPSKSIVSSMPPATPITEKPTNSAVLSVQQPIVKLIKLPPTSIASTPCDTQYSKEQIVEKAKQEAYVMQRIAELQREGLWSERRLPKLQEPTRTKAHWDYLLEEMVWLAADFAQERKWKKAAAKKCARMVQKHFQEKAIQAQKAEKLQELRLKKIASFIAKEIKTFWTNVEKLVEYKQQTRLEEKRKKVLDQHLNFIVGQTERYSTWLTEGLNKTEGNQSVPASINSSRISSPVTTGKVCSDDEFEPNQSSDDDEETIAKAEEEMKSTNHVEEVELLKKESELPLEDLLKELPPNYLEQRDKSLSPTGSKSEDEEEDDENQNDEMDDDEDTSKNEDGEFKVASEEDSSDDEDTIMEQERKEKNVDHRQEIDELNAENEMSIDELMAKYNNLGDVPMNVDESDESENDEKEEDESDQESLGSSAEEDEDKPEHESSQTQSEDETGVGLKSLLEDFSSEKLGDDSMNDSQARKEMDDVAALAESIQPKGNTLLTTSVVTKIPFLLKHCLREYQHIGLDWLVTMYERKLNGILADEMGLGKTIQTIALLAHLACEQENWGPHLIIVPTSVMLNWEMEFKKWCPGFKILTYYGTQKERKQKRTGWTKPNAFHICITSYKLVIQDHQSFRRKKWKYLILDEAQNIKNFKSQRWQLLLNFQTQRRLLLTGTPLQNNLMELWSLMHFLMPNVFQSHREFREWFSNPVTGMIEGNSEYNENIIRRLHKVLRPFLLRRLKTEVEKQLPKKYEHVIMCRLSKRQRFLYDDFMSRAKTKETLASGNLLSVINVLMQLRKVCNHPNLFEVRPTVSPFQMEGIDFVTASLVWSALDYDLFKDVSHSYLNLNLLDLEGNLTAYMAHRIKRCQTPRKLIEEIDSHPEPSPRCPPGKIKIDVRLSNEPKSAAPQQAQAKVKNYSALPATRVGTSPLVKGNQSTSTQGVTLRVADGQQLQGYSVQLVPHQGSVKAIPVSSISQNPRTSTVTTTTVSPQRISVTNANVNRIAQTVTVKQSDSSVQRISMPSFAQLVQTSTGKHLILTSTQQSTNAISLPVMTSSGQRLAMVPKSSLVSLASTTTTSSSSTLSSSPQPSTMNISAVAGKPLMRVPPLNISASSVQLSSSQVNRIVNKTQKDEDKIKEQPKSHFYSPQLEEDRKQRRQTKLKNIADINERRCAACPLYGEDLFLALRIGKPATSCPWHNGSLQVSAAKDTCRTRRQFFSRTEALAEAIKSTEKIVEELKEVFQRYVVCVPAVQAPSPRFHVSHPPPHKLWAHQRMEIKLQKKLAPKFAVFHPITSQMMTQFPDPRLIQYDCGKLQSLNLLLRRLKAGNHRALIFTQMTRMLDVLEAFLNYHGHIYLRLDGATKVDQRQILMERFNGDARIFCFILSTRSGGVGVNLTGADTVIFYDSDWNPTMDAQAQDRCHRIGQTRDVHIYRLVSEKTIEENILKKANQKRLLGDLAIEGGNFTTAYFKNSTIQDLFNIENSENDASTRMAEILEQNKEREKSLQKDAQPDEKVAMGVLENALAAAEEDLDVQAAKTAKAEAVAELAEFDENIPIEDAEKEDTQISKAEQEVQNLVSQLTPVERYAMKFVEECDGNFSAAQLAAAERELEEQKKEWEMNRLKALREEEERRMRIADDDEEPLTYGREDAQNQIWLSTNTMEQMPMWGPPTPPTTDNDVYVDYSLGFLYEFTPISEAQLPPIYVRKENLKRKSDTIMSERDGRRPAKTRHKEESMYAPRSLFDRTLPGMLKMNRGMKMHRYRASMVRSPMQPANIKPSPVLKPLTEQDNILEWMIHEDWALLQAVQVYQDLPLDLVCQYPGHTPNWDFVADIVNNTSRIYRSPKQCRNRYESVIVPREEGKLFYDTSPKKKKQKNLCKIPQVAEQQSKTNRPMKTLQLYNADKNYSFTSMSIQRFDIIKDLEMTNRKTLVAKGVHASASPKNSKHMTVLVESNIQYDCPLSPLEVASRRAERIAKEKLKNAVNSQQAAAVRLQQQQQQQQQQIQMQQQQSQSQAQSTASTLPQTHQLVQSASSTVPSQTVATLKTTNTVTNVSVTAANVVTAAVKSRVAATLNMQEVRTTTTVVSMANLQGAQRLSTTSGLVSVPPNVATAAATQKSIMGVTVATSSGNKTMITPAQLQYYRQLQRQSQMKVLQAPAGAGQKVQVAVSSSPATAQQRATLMKQQQLQGSNVAGNSSSPGTVVKQAITRPVTDTEMALLKQRQAALQQQQQQQTKMTQMQVPAQTGLTPAQIFAHAGLQVQQQACASSGAGCTPVATLVKTNVAGVRAATPQQIRQLTLHSQFLAQRKLPGQKVAQIAQVAGKAGVQTQLIVQPKPLPVTMQQIQLKSTNMHQFTHVTTGQSVSQPSQVVLAKSPLHTRVIPVASAALKQTIQVVTAGSAQLRQTSPAQSKPVNTNRGSPGPSQVRLQTISHQAHPQQIQQQPPSQQSQESQQK